MTEPGPAYLSTLQAARLLGCRVPSLITWSLYGRRVNGMRVPLGCVHAGCRSLFTAEMIERFRENCRRAEVGEPFDFTDVRDPAGERARRRQEALDRLLDPWKYEPPARRPKPKKAPKKQPAPDVLRRR